MHVFEIILASVLLTTTVTAAAELGADTLPKYSLPPETLAAIEQLGEKNDVLILGEMHGTQEVPAVVQTLLGPLSKQGYDVLAIEVPSDEQVPLTQWATGKTEAIPKFFAKPLSDGRGNIQLLKLIRAALLPPVSWKLICFDETQEKLFSELQGAIVTDLKVIYELSKRRDAGMAVNFSEQRQRLDTNAKVLAICGNLHARTENHASEESPLSSLWPSFAAVLKREHPKWRVNSINVKIQTGGYFNGGKVNAFYPDPGRSSEKVETHELPEGDWDLELTLPKGTPATFLAAPADPPMPPGNTKPSSNKLPPHSTFR